MHKSVKVRLSNKRVKQYKKELIENVEDAAVISSTPIKRNSKKMGRPRNVTEEDVKVSVPFHIASKLNQEVNIRKAQNQLRKQLSVFIEENFADFIDDYRRLGNEPALRSRLFLELIKIVLPRQKEQEVAADSGMRNKLIEKLFSSQK